MTGSSPATGHFAFPLFSLLQGLEKLPGDMPADIVTSSGEVHAHQTASIRLHRLFDLFFESYWCRHTGLTHVALSGTLNGKATIEIWRRDALSGQERLAASVYTEGHERAVEIAVPLQRPCDDDEASYLVAVLHLARGATLRDLRWCTAAAPVRNVRIAGVICTFNRDDMLSANLTRFAATSPFLHRLVVVNQGAPGLADRMAQTSVGLPMPLLLVDQPNLGGAGGFTRGIVESLKDADVTHVLLMDDDIDAQPALLARIATILAYAGARHCIGGAMLDIHDSGRLFSCGDRLHPDRPAIINVAPEPGDDDARTDAGRDFLARPHQLDFNGWWCFAFPVEAVRQCGLPLPLFIRGDDVEYGLRLTRAGFPTIGWPGVAVWHMPFASKARPWQAFYDRRNMLFLNELHQLYSRRRIARSAWGSFLNALRARAYGRAEAIVAGVRAFNHGPTHLARWSGDDHAELMRRTEEPEHGHWRRSVALCIRAIPAIAALRWGRRSDSNAVRRLAGTGFWQAYLPEKTCEGLSACNKGFASHPDDGIAVSQQVQTTSVNSCDPF